MRSQDGARRIVTKIRELPPLPVVAQKLLAVMRDDNSSADDVTEVISSDQALAGKVLKLVNSSFYGFTREISTITRAVVILGHSAIRNLALGIGMSEAVKRAGGPIDHHSYWDHALCCASGARSLAPYLNYPDSEEAFIAGLLHDIGQFVLNLAMPREYRELLADGCSDLVAREKTHLGMGHHKVGQRLLEHWLLPSNLCNVARFHHTPQVVSSGEEPLVTLTAVGDVLAYIRGNASLEEPDRELLCEISRTIGLTSQNYAEILAEMDRRVEDARVFLQIADLPDDGTVAHPVRSEPSTYTVIGRHGNCADWARTVLEYLGHRVVPAEVFMSGSDEAGSVAIVLVDAADLEPAQLLEIEENLWGRATQLAVFVGREGSEALPESLSKYPMIPYIFSQNDLNQLQAIVLAP